MSKWIAALMLGTLVMSSACSEDAPKAPTAPRSAPPAQPAGASAGSSFQIPEPEIENTGLMGKVRSNELRRRVLENPSLRAFSLDWAINPDGLFANTFMGVPTIQNPTDAWITHEILFEVKPDFLVETGTLQGGSAALWATYLEQIHPEARVITIDIEDQVTTAKELPIVQRKVDFLLGSSVAPEIVAEVKRRVGDGRVMVILDSSHTEEHVFAELQAYSPLVSLGSYLIVQDTGIAIPRYERWPGKKNELSGADRAVRRFMQGNTDFETDMWRERLILTHNPTGYLKRVR